MPTRCEKRVGLLSDVLIRSSKIKNIIQVKRFFGTIQIWREAIMDILKQVGVKKK